MTKIYFFLAFLAFYFCSSAQEYRQAVGVGSILGYYKFAENAKDFAIPTGVQYRASLVWQKDSAYAFALSAYPLLAISGIAQLITENKSSGLSFEFPLNVEYYPGSFDEVREFIGGGLNIISIRNNNFQSSTTGLIFGPQLALGIKFTKRSIFEELNQRTLGFRLSFTQGLNRVSKLPGPKRYMPYAIGLNMFYNF